MLQIIIPLMLVVEAAQIPVHFHDRLTDEGILMKIDFKDEEEDFIKIKELEKYQLNNFLWHLPFPKQVITSSKDVIIKKAVVPPETNYDDNGTWDGKNPTKELKRVARNVDPHRPAKRDTLRNEADDYNYDYLKLEYYEGELKEMEETNVTVDIGPKREGNRVKDAVRPIVDVKVAKNCTDKDRKGYGVRAIRCGFKDLFAEGLTKRVKDLFRKVVVFWSIVYAVVATPLWLVNGWCCCCFRCQFCFPDRVVYKIKNYLVHNPPGLIILADGNTKTYEASNREIKLFKSLEIKTHTF